MGDSLGPCKGEPVDGIQVLPPLRAVAGGGAAAGGVGAGAGPSTPAKAAAPAVAIEEGKTSSPASTGPQKYFVGKIYSGCNPRTIQGKVAQLESLLTFMQKRFEDKHGTTVKDATELFGVAVLVLNGAVLGRSRSDILALGVSIMQAGMGPLLSRLAECGRVCVIVLDARQAGATHAARCMAQALASTIVVVDEAAEL